MNSRREFPKKVRLAAFDRAKGQCEKCTARLFYGNYEYDHIIPDALGGEPTLENCIVICRSCHKKKTGEKDIPIIAKMKRNRARAAGIERPRTIRAWRKFDGTIVKTERNR